MGFFLGCLVIAIAIVYVGRRIARVLFVMGGMLEEIGKGVNPNWPPLDAWKRAFHIKD